MTCLLRDKGVEEEVDLRFISVDDVKDDNPPKSHTYSNVIIDDVHDESLDFALVNVLKLRVLCMKRVIQKIKPNGLLILDNAERFFLNKIMGQ